MASGRAPANIHRKDDVSNLTAPTGTEAEDIDDRAPAVPGRYAAEAQPQSKRLKPHVRRTLGRLKKYVAVDDLVSLGLLTAGQRPTLDDVDGWCWRETRGGIDLYADTISRDELRAIVTGHDPRRQVALSTLDDLATETGAEWASLAVKRLRDKNTVARAEPRRRSLALTLTVADLMGIGATAADVAALPADNESTRAASVKIVETWTEVDRDAARKKPRPAARIELTRASAVTREHIDWLWTTEGIDPNMCGVQAALIPLRGLTLVAGREGAAKSLFSLWLAAQVTRGQLPGHYAGQPRDVVILATEDTSSTIRMRLEAAGADLDRAHLPVLRDAEGIELPISIRDNTDQLADMLDQIEPGLVILDPLKDFLGDDVNTDREHEVRPALTPLLKLTEDHEAPVLGLHHLNKSRQGDFLTRLTGSGAFKNVARSILGVAHDEENDIRVLQQKKANLAASGRGAFQGRVQGVDLTVDGRTQTVGRWVMDGVSLSDIDAVLATKEQGGRGPSEHERAAAFLRDRLSNSPQPSSQIKEAGAQLGFSEATLKRAFASLGGKSERAKAKQPGTVWSLSVDDGADDA